MELSPTTPIAVIADVHGNADALKAVLADIDAQGIGPVLNLGDHLSGPLAAAESAQILMARDMVHIRGNHDRWLIEQDAARMGASDKAAYDQLGPAHLDWLRSLPPTRTVSDDIFMCHGTPQSDTQYWLEQVLADGTIAMRSRAAIEAAAEGITCRLILCAHTHTARAVRLADGRLVVNPGSVGLPAYDDDTPVAHIMQTGAPEARYAVMRKTSAGWDVSFRAVPYDTSRMAQMARDADRDSWANAIATGWLNAGS